jgi:hypothetical protein
MPPADSVTVEQPKHPLPALTTFELRDYRRQLERAIVFFDGRNPVPPTQAVLQARPDAGRRPVGSPPFVARLGAYSRRAQSSADPSSVRR